MLYVSSYTQTDDSWDDDDTNSDASSGSPFVRDSDGELSPLIRTIHSQMSHSSDQYPSCNHLFRDDSNHAEVNDEDSCWVFPALSMSDESQANNQQVAGGGKLLRPQPLTSGTNTRKSKSYHDGADVPPAEKLEAGNQKCKARKQSRFQHVGDTVSDTEECYNHLSCGHNPPHCDGSSNTAAAVLVAGPSLLEVGLTNGPLGPSHNTCSLTRKPPLKCTIIDEPTLPSDDEKKYTQVFQKYFAVQISLNATISQSLKSVHGVKSLGVGFSTKRDGYWPVIRVIADEETCKEMKQEKEKGIMHRKTTLIENVVVALKRALTQLHPSTSWIEEELKNTIEIVIKYPLKAYELRSAGDVVKTTYRTTTANSSKQGVMACSVRHKFSVGSEYVHSRDYEITAYHPVIPSQNTHFQQTLYPLPETAAQLETRVQYKYIKESEEDSGDVVAIQSNDSLLSSTLLRATVFPDQAKKAFQTMKQNFGYGCSTYSAIPTTHGQLSYNAELVVGKSGLVKYLVTNDELEERSYEYNIVENQIQNHPCNIDIAVLKYINDGTRHISHQIKESFPQLSGITLKGPPDPGQGFEGMKGEVVYLANGEVHLLSKNGLIKMNDPPIADEYPGYAWDPLENLDVPHGHSGSPVFLVSQDGTTYHLLGSLITDRSASPLGFSLKMVHAEIAIHHIDQILAEQLEYMYETATLSSDMIAQLKKYRQYLIWHNEHQSLSPLIEGKYIHCRMELSDL